MSMGRVQEAQTVLAAVETLPQGRATSERAPTVLELLSLPRADRLARRVAKLTRGVELSPQDVDVKLRLASTLVDAGRTGEADATLRKIDGPWKTTSSTPGSWTRQEESRTLAMSWCGRFKLPAAPPMWHIKQRC